MIGLRPGDADRLRAKFAAAGSMEGLAAMRTVHDLRWVFFDNDTRLLFATAYDGDWDAYVDDFATRIPDLMDFIFSEVSGWPGIRSPEIKDFVVKHQLTADAWFVANPDQRVGDVARNAKVAAAVDSLLDAVNP